MKAEYGHLRVDQSYKLVKCEYTGKYLPYSLPSTCCMNCDLPISNIAHVVGSIDKREYMIGLDCAAALTSISPSEIKQAKKKLALDAKFRKWIALEMKSYLTVDGRTYLFDNVLSGEYDSSILRRAPWTCTPDYYSFPDKVKLLITNTFKKPSEYSDYSYTMYTIGV
jgi:hypothetical protein